MKPQQIKTICMKWYLAKIVFRIICGDGEHMAQFDEQLRLIEAVDGASAFNKAALIGRQESDNFLNAEQQMVQWVFINVAELYQLGEMTDGAEMYSRIEEYDNADAYVSTVHRRARSVREQLLEPIPENV
jgi:hypothetical protein